MMFSIDSFGSLSCLPSPNECPEDIVIPNTIDGITVTTLLPHFLKGNNKIKTITIPNTVVNIEQSAFECCSNLETVIFEADSKLHTIGSEAFADCEKLRDFDFTKLRNLHTICPAAFRNTKSLKEADLSQVKVIDIPNEAFYNSGLKSLKLSKDIYEVGEKAFSNTKIKELDFSQMAQFNFLLSENCFAGSAVETINFNNNSEHTIINIFDEAFQNCKYLKSVKLPTNIVLLGPSIFKNCSNLKSASLFTGFGDEKSLWIPQETFANCTSLYSLELGRGLARICCRAFSGCSSLKEIKCYSDLEEIGDYAFEMCYPLDYLDLSACHNTFIQSGVFKYTSLSNKNLLVDFFDSLHFNEDSFENIKNFNIDLFKEEHPFCSFTQ